MITSWLLSALLWTSPTAQDFLTSVQCLTDTLEPIEGAVIQLSTGSGTWTKVTNLDGQTPWMSMDPSDGFDLVLADRALPSGTALGLIERNGSSLFVPDESADIAETSITRTQPIAVPILVDGLPDRVAVVLPPGGRYFHWRIAVPTGSALRFSMEVAPLLDGAIIQEYLEYRGVQPLDSYTRGVALVVPGVNLGQGGFFVGVKLLGDLEGGCEVDAYNIHRPTRTLIAGPPLQASVVRIEHDIALVWVRGKVAPGHLALLLRPAGLPPRVQVLVDDPPMITTPPDAGEGVEFASNDSKEDKHALPASLGTLLSQGDCVPPVAQAPEGWECTPSTPEPDEDCAGPPAAGARECTTVRQGSPIFCRPAGFVLGMQRIKTRKWKVSFNVGGEGLVGPGKLQSGGGFEYGQDSTEVLNDQWTPQGANGQCIRFWIITLVCVQPFETPTHGYIWVDGLCHIDPCADINTTISSCTDTLYTVTVCDR